MVSHAVAVAVAIALFTVILVLPGFGAIALTSARRGGTRRHEPLGLELARAASGSILLLAVLSYALVGFGWFSPERSLVGILPFALLGLPGAARFARRAVSCWRPGLLLATTLAPFVPVLTSDGYKPARGFNWYYWDLGRSMTAAGGVPSWVAEFGMQLRWHPDYLTFNILSETYRAAFSSLFDDAAAVDTFKFPLAALTLALLYATLRLWFTRWPATFGAALAMSTSLFTLKLGNGRPEIAGFVAGLAATVLVVQAMRRREPATLVFGVAVLAVATSIHGIGVIVPGALIATSAVMELWQTRAQDRRRLGIALVVAASFGVAIIVATGWALQGRASVVSDAANPQTVEGTDPTFTYLRVSEGLFSPADPPDGIDFTGAVRPPWRGVNFATRTWVVVSLGLVVGAALIAASGDSRAKRGLLVATGTGGILMAGVLYFGLSFDTFVPQRTGWSRFLQWAPLVWVLVATAGAAAVEGAMPDDASPRRRRLVPLAAIAATGLAVVLLHAHFEGARFVDDEHESALEALRLHARPGDSTLTNATTSGILEFVSETEVPLEGRQPVIEPADVLLNATSRILDAREYLEGPHAADPPDGTTLVLVTDRPGRLGAVGSFGGSVSRFSSVGDVLHRSENVVLTRVADPPAVPAGRVGPVIRTPRRTAMAIGAVAVLAILAGAITRREFDESRQQASVRSTTTTPSRTRG